MKFSSHATVAAGLSILLMACEAPQTASEAEIVTEDDKTFYFLGATMGRQLSAFEITDQELELVVRGLRESLAGTAEPVDAAFQSQRAQEMMAARAEAAAKRNEGAGTAYLTRMASEEGAVTTDSGIVVRELSAGSGESPTAESMVRAHYHGTLTDGTVFDSSVERGEPFQASLGAVIPCWREAIPMMKVGGKSKISCPAAMAYGNRATGSIPPGSVLTFEVELLEIVN